ncbi:MAG TPA: hypothetical protein VKQ36_14140 [Ktedonobacterales bacterium]|nr:hypothetical protein [Ktedonobacterales bacterium]
MSPYSPHDPNIPGYPNNPEGSPIPGGYVVPPSADVNPQNAPTILSPQLYSPPGMEQPPYRAGQPWGAQPSGPINAPALARPWPAWTLIAGGALIALLLVAVILLLMQHINFASSPGAQQGNQAAATATSAALATTTPTGENTPTSVPQTQITPLVPAGTTIYETATPGQCDQRGATWGANPYAGQACLNGALQLTGLGNCNCPLGVVVLRQLSGGDYPTQYVVQVEVNSVGPGDTDRFGIKFYQADSGPNTPDTGLARGGYTFLIDRTGAWNFNYYASDGTLTTLASGVYTSGVMGQHTLDLSVGPSAFVFSIDGTEVASEYDTAYTSGLIDLVSESGAVVDYQNFALYAQPGA